MIYYFFYYNKKSKNIKANTTNILFKNRMENNTKIIFRLNEKNKNRDNLNCMAYANYIRYLLIL